jgi:hypothetical protein
MLIGNLQHVIDDDKRVWPTWAVGVLSGVRDNETIGHTGPAETAVEYVDPGLHHNLHT